MNYFDSWHALNARFDQGDLTALTQLVGYKLFAIDNELRHPESFTLSDRELMSRTNINSGQTIVAARRALKNAGIIDFKTAKARPTTYRLLIQSSNNQATIKQESSKIQASGVGSNIHARDPSLKLEATDNSSSNAGANIQELDNVLEYWADMGGSRLAFEHQSELAALIERHGAPFVCEVIKSAADANGSRFGLSMKFFRSVLATRLKGGDTRGRSREARLVYQEPDTSWI